MFPSKGRIANNLIKTTTLTLLVSFPRNSCLTPWKKLLTDGKEDMLPIMIPTEVMPTLTDRGSIDVYQGQAPVHHPPRMLQAHIRLQALVDTAGTSVMEADMAHSTRTKILATKTRIGAWTACLWQRIQHNT